MAQLELVNSKTIDEALSLLHKFWFGRKHLKHFNAKTVDEAIALLSDYMEEAKIIAGGIDLIRLLRNKIASPMVLVNIKTIPSLAGITEDAEGLKIGALATIRDIETSAIIKGKYSMLADAAHSVASPQIRNMATVGGNLCQDVNCWYYRRAPITGRMFNCRRKGGTSCYAVTGDNRYHAIIGGNRCFAVCPSDLAPTLIALNAKMKVASPNGERVLSLEELYTAMGNTLKSNELMTEIQVPSVKPNTKQRYLKFRLRKAIDFAISSVATVITTEARVVTDARIVLGGVAPTPYRAFGAEDAIRGKVIRDSVAERAAKASVSEAVPLSMNAYKIPITETLVKRAVLD